MVPSRSLFYFLTLVLTYCSSLVSTAPWIVTEYYEEIPISSHRAYWESTWEVTTSIEEITPTVTSLPEAISTITSVGSSYSSDVTVIQQLYASGVGTPVYNDYYGYEDYDHITIYVVNLTYSAPTGCSTQWTTTAAATVSPPSAVGDLLPRTAVSTSLSVDSSEPFSPTTYTYDYVWVDPTQIPRSSLGCLSDEFYPSTLYEGSGCHYKGNGCYYTGNYDGYYGYGGPWYNDAYGFGISPLAIMLICILGWVGLFFILGIIEAWVRFRRLMTGWQTRRGLPVCWAFMVLPITLLFLCCFRKGYRARNAADAAFLQQKWNDMSFWKKLRLFFVWGFRYRYPSMLGPAPARVKVSKRPGKDAGPPLLNTTPPHTAAEAGHAPRVERGAPGAVSEMGQVPTGAPQPSSHVVPRVPEASGALSENRDEEIGRAR